MFICCFKSYSEKATQAHQTKVNEELTATVVVSARSTFQERFSISRSNCPCWYSNFIQGGIIKITGKGLTYNLLKAFYFLPCNRHMGRYILKCIDTEMIFNIYPPMIACFTLVKCVAASFKYCQSIQVPSPCVTFSSIFSLIFFSISCSNSKLFLWFSHYIKQNVNHEY